MVKIVADIGQPYGGLIAGRASHAALQAPLVKTTSDWAVKAWCFTVAMRRIRHCAAMTVASTHDDAEARVVALSQAKAVHRPACALLNCPPWWSTRAAAFAGTSDACSAKRRLGHIHRCAGHPFQRPRQRHSALYKLQVRSKRRIELSARRTLRTFLTLYQS
jgi:hypothetical protein